MKFRHSSILFLTLIVFLSAGCEKKEPMPVAEVEIKDEAELPNQLIRNFEARFMDKGTTAAILKSGRARVFRNRNETLLDSGVYVEFYSKDTGKLLSILTSDSARTDDKTKDMLALSNVKVVSDTNDIVLTTEVLEWHNEDRRIYTTEFVTINSSDRFISGYGFESDLGLTDYTIYKVTVFPK